MEDLSFSPDGTFLSFLDQGNDCFMPASSPSHNYELKSESEVVLLHLPSQQARRFGSRKEVREPCNSDRYLTSVPTGILDSTRMPGRARLWWHGFDLMSHGPGVGFSDFLPASYSYGEAKMRDHGFYPNVIMPCERLDLC